MEGLYNTPQFVFNFLLTPLSCHCHSLVLAYLLNEEASGSCQGGDVRFLVGNKQSSVISVSGLDGAYAGLKPASTPPSMGTEEDMPRQQWMGIRDSTSNSLKARTSNEGQAIEAC